MVPPPCSEPHCISGGFEITIAVIRSILGKTMRRRDFIKAIASSPVAAWPSGAHAQQPEHLRRIGVLMAFAESDPATQEYVSSFKRGLSDAGWVEGRNLAIEYRWNVVDAVRAKTYAAELSQLQLDAILAVGGASMTALHALNGTTPIVFVLITDPIAQGFVKSLARPGGNITGFTTLELTMGGKWLEVLRELQPGLSRVSVIFAPEVNSYADLLIKPMQAMETSTKIVIVPAPIRNESDIDTVIREMHRASDAFVVLQDAYTVAKRRIIIDRGNQAGICGIFPTPLFVRDGGLISYGPDLGDQFARAASYIDRILRGAPAGDLPVQQPVKFKLVINFKTSKALGFAIPQTLQTAADEVIE
jgi:ABC-type uncharacterized transport system substrate-binding protein